MFLTWIVDLIVYMEHGTIIVVFVCVMGVLKTSWVAINVDFTQFVPFDYVTQKKRRKKKSCNILSCAFCLFVCWLFFGR